MLRVLVAALVAALAFAANAHAADYGWSTTQVLSSQGQPGSLPSVAMNDSGQAVVAWLEPDAAGVARVRVRFRRPGENFGDPTGFYIENGISYASAPGAAASGVNVEIDPNGNALVAWNRAGNFEVASGTPNSGLGQPTNLATGFGSDITMDAQGNAIAGMVRQHSGNPWIESRYKPAGGTWGPFTLVWDSVTAGAPGPGGERAASAPTVALDDQGNAAFSWTANQNSWNQDRFLRDMWGAFLPAGGTWEAAHRFPASTRGTSPGYAALSAAPTDIAVRNGETIVGWNASDSSDTRVHVQFRPRGGPWDDATQTLSDVAPSNNMSGHNFGPGLSVDPQGNVLATWLRQGFSEIREVNENWLPASASRFEARRALTPGVPRHGGGAAGFDAAGNALMSIIRYGPDNSDSDQWFAATRAPGKDGALGALQPVSETGNFLGGQWDVTASGGAVAVWARVPTSGADLTRRVEVRFGTPPPPADPVVPPPPPPPATPPPPPPPPIPRPNGSIDLARQAKSGEAVVLTANTVGPVDRLEWDFGSGQPKVTAGVVNGRLQKSIRLRGLPREASVKVKAFGPGGEITIGQPLTLPRDPTDALSKEVDRGLSKSGIGKVVAIGDADVLTGRSSACGTLSVISGSQTLTGCFKPIDDITDIPSRELGALQPLAQALGLNGARADLMQKAVELSDGYITQARMAIPGGWPVVPANGASLISYPQAEALTSSNASVLVGGIPFKPPGSGFNLKLDRSSVATKLGKLPRPPSLPKIGGFDLGGDFDIQLLSGEARIKASIKLPSFIKKAGVDVQASINLRATPDRLIIDDLSIGPINVNVGGLKVDGLRVTYNRAADEWLGVGQACITSLACLDMRPPNGQIRIKDGRLAFAGASLGFPAPGIPIATGVNMERIGFGVGLDPTRFTANAKLVFAHLLVIDGRLVMAFPDAQTPFTLRRDEVGDGFPAKLYTYRYTGFTMGITANAALRLPVVGDVPIGGAYVLYEYPGYLALGGHMDYGFKAGGVTLIGVKGRVDGEFYSVTGRFNVDGHVQGCVIDVLCKGFDGNVSSNGMSVCTSVDAWLHDFHVGGAIRWSPFKFIPYLDGCKWGRFREANVRPVKAAQAGGAVYTMDRGDADDASEMVMLSGTDGAPRVRVTGPSGQVLDSPAGSELAATQDPKVRIMRSEQGKFTAVALAGARPGDYKIEMLPGSPGISKIEESTQLPDARAAGIVEGDGARKTLTYDVTERANQRVTFVDIDGTGAASEIKTITGGGRGKVAFRPKPGKQIRRIEARFEVDGVPAESLPVARYRPPSPMLPRPAGLKVRRSGTKLIVSWKKVRDASSYELALTPSGSDVQKFFTSRKTKITLRGVSKSVRGRVTVQGVASMRHGRPSSAKFKRTARASSGFRDLEDCKKKGKKLTCR